MTLPTEFSDDTAARARIVAASKGQDQGTIAAAPISGGAPAGADSPRVRHSLMDFAGAGVGRPGAIGENVDACIRSMRDEWVERESRRKPLPWDEFFTAMTEGIDSNLPPLSDYAISREGIYEDHM